MKPNSVFIFKGNRFPEVYPRFASEQLRSVEVARKVYAAQEKKKAMNEKRISLAQKAGILTLMIELGGNIKLRDEKDKKPYGLSLLLDGILNIGTETASSLVNSGKKDDIWTPKKAKITPNVFVVNKLTLRKTNVVKALEEGIFPGIDDELIEDARALPKKPPVKTLLIADN